MNVGLSGTQLAAVWAASGRCLRIFDGCMMEMPKTLPCPASPTAQTAQMTAQGGSQLMAAQSP